MTKVHGNFEKVNVPRSLKDEAAKKWCGSSKEFLNISRFSEAAYRLLLDKMDSKKEAKK